MVKLRTSRTLQLIMLLLVCTTSGLVGFAFRGNSERTLTIPQQSDEKVIERKEYGYEPFKFDNLSVRKVKIAPNQKLNARSLAESQGGQLEDWLEDLEFTIKNKWDKTITYLDLDLTFPETRGGRPMMVYDLDIGIHPSAVGDAVKYGKPLALNADETLTFNLSAERLKKIKRFLALGGFELINLNKVVIRIGYIIFEDGMKWEQGSWYKPISGEEPSAGKPGQYVKLTVNPN